MFFYKKTSKEQTIIFKINNQLLKTIKISW